MRIHLHAIKARFRFIVVGQGPYVIAGSLLNVNIVIHTQDSQIVLGVANVHEDAVML